MIDGNQDININDDVLEAQNNKDNEFDVSDIRVKSKKNRRLLSNNKMMAGKTNLVLGLTR